MLMNHHTRDRQQRIYHSVLLLVKSQLYPFSTYRREKKAGAEPPSARLAMPSLAMQPA
jgi:hypothetical protein